MMYQTIVGLLVKTTLDELLTQDSTDTITNKTISGSSNTITNIGNSAIKL